MQTGLSFAFGLSCRRDSHLDRLFNVDVYTHHIPHQLVGTLMTPISARVLRQSVVLSCASWCQLQRAPLGKWLNLHVTLSQLPLIMPGSRVRVPPFPPIRSACYRSDPRLPTRRKRTVSAESRPPSVLDQEIQVFGAALISAHHSEVEIVGPVRNRPRDLSFPPTLPPLN